MTQRLNQHSLARVRPTASVPSYTRPTVPGVVHLGLGAFHRAHQAVVFDDLMQQGDPRWGVLGVAMRSTAVADSLGEQDGLYSLQVGGAEHTRCRIVQSVLSTCVAAREPAVVIAAIGNPATRWVTMTVTEKGYTPEVLDLIARGLEIRRANGYAGLTLASCDNLSGNGDRLQAACMDAVSDPLLRQWVRDHCAFPNAMVDRIVPAATEQCRDAAQTLLGLSDHGALGTEEFWEWIIEDRFADPSDADALRAAGVTVVASVKPFEDAKLRMLNGSHSAIACLGGVLGIPTIADCVGRPEIRRFVHGLMTHETMPGVARPNASAYRHALLERFANPTLKHSVHQVATDSSKKIPQRWLPSALSQLERGGPIDHLALATAAWMLYCRGMDQAGHPFLLNDPLAPALQAMARQYAGDAGGTVRVMLGVAEVWGTDLPNRAVWRDRVAHWLQRAQSVGLTGALEEINLAASNG